MPSVQLTYCANGSLCPSRSAQFLIKSYKILSDEIDIFRNLDQIGLSVSQDSSVNSRGGSDFRCPTCDFRRFFLSISEKNFDFRVPTFEPVPISGSSYFRHLWLFRPTSG
ncbi:unnamed protein product [Meloidogyne enterolobii]|uniref:Uncharacterized protein n=1 Tax=Meloidogyne enterolobii TaxID=390850 RepID=A0ACB0XX20_MELEN